MIAASIQSVPLLTCKAGVKVISAAHQQATASEIIRQAYPELLLLGTVRGKRTELSSNEDQSNTHFLGVV